MTTEQETLWDQNVSTGGFGFAAWAWPVGRRF